MLRVRLRDALLDHAEHDVVGHELAGVHDLLGLLPERRLVGDGSRSRSPVETCGNPWSFWMRCACVPLPEPGAPSMTIRMTVSPTGSR